MNQVQFETFKQSVYYANKRDNSDRFDRLMERVEKECSPQQKGAITRMLREYEERSMDREAGASYY